MLGKIKHDLQHNLFKKRLVTKTKYLKKAIPMILKI